MRPRPPSREAERRRPSAGVWGPSGGPLVDGELPAGGAAVVRRSAGGRTCGAVSVPLPAVMWLVGF